MDHITRNIAALNFGEDMIYRLDHLMPLCDLLQMPLFVHDRYSYELCEALYPANNAKILEEKESLNTLAQFDLLFVSDKFTARDLGQLLRTFCHKNVRFFYVPHGNSDKGHITLKMDQFQWQDMALIYGKQMHQRLQQFDLLRKIRQTVRIGNLRKQYYLRHQKFFDRKTQQAFPQLAEKKFTILYAPTWNDGENTSSFSLICSKLAKSLPNDCRIIIKLHPFLEKFSPQDVACLTERYRDHENVLVTSSFPLVYPLLQQSDVYLGDFSSMGYDFLYFNRPMFFIDPDCRKSSSSEDKYLYRCGIEIPKSSWNNPLSYIFAHLKQNSRLKELRRETYSYAFDEDYSMETLKKEILGAYYST